ncbi:MAG: hypothetical protein N3A69_12020, partial [Leptospiraceae bacterium]|nr:hypothetical protein [Leptospiraceae bacterium]
KEKKMSKYYSRTPEEFRKYLDSLRKSDSKRNWRNLIYFIDLALLMFVFFMISKLLNPALDVNLKSSTKEKISSSEIYFAKTNLHEKDIATYYLFIKNLGTSHFYFPETSAEFWIANELGEICYKKNLNFPSKDIPPNTIDSIAFKVPKISKDNLKENCKSLYKKPPFPKTIDTIFDFSKKYRFDSYLRLEGQLQRELILSDDYWR